MLFNSFEFVLFFPAVVLLYFIFPHKYRWAFLAVASYYFYMNWQPIYAVLIFSSTLVTYFCGTLLEKFNQNKQKKRLFLILSLVLNFGILFVFKYFNFINESIFALLEQFNIRWKVPNLDILLPVGISFYTFQAVGYTIDVYKNKIKAEKHFGIYALFVSFFPQLVAGPIERAKNLLPQFREKHFFKYDNLSIGFKQLIWGYFMKVVVADRVSIYVNAVYNNVENHNGTTFILATVLFAIQIYCDFAGYSNIAIGTARIMGFDLMQNFNRPYFSKSIGEFWKRWHISLSTWFRDYLYIPLGGNRVNALRHLFNLFVTFLISGIWHGANWTFVIWGAMHGLFLIFEVLLKKLTNLTKLSFLNWLITIGLVLITWIFFRANSIHDAIFILEKVLLQHGQLFIDKNTLVYSLAGIIILFAKEIKDEFHIPIHFSSSLVSKENFVSSL